MAWRGAGTKSLCAFLHTDTNYITLGSTASYQFDTLGFEQATIDVILSSANTTSNAPSLVVLSESLTTTTSTAGDIIALTMKTGTSTSAAVVIPQTGLNTSPGALNVYRFNVDLRQRWRYLTVRVSPSNDDGGSGGRAARLAQRDSDCGFDVWRASSGGRLSKATGRHRATNNLIAAYKPDDNDRRTNPPTIISARRAAPRGRHRGYRHSRAIAARAVTAADRGAGRWRPATTAYAG